jgi:photoactive yellow protein
MNGARTRTLPPGELWATPGPRPVAANGSSVCSHCGADPHALAASRAEREQLVDELRAVSLELAELRRGSAVGPSTRRTFEPSIPTAAPSFAPFVPATSAPAPGMVASSDQGIDFGAVARLSPEELDRLPYGLITLDANGRVIHYNDTESRLVGLPKERVLGRSFFADVAPCTRVREFEGRFLELARDPIRVRVQSFDFVFRFARGEHHVSIVITPARARGQFHMALVRRAIVA